MNVDTSDRHPLDDLPRLSSRQVALDRLIARSGGFREFADLLSPGLPLEVGAVETLWRASGLTRPGVVAQLAWPRRKVRVGFGLETALVHGLVDRLLGYSRIPAEAHLQVTPVEWGILSFVFARALDRLGGLPGPLGPWDLTIDRVGPDPFDPRDLGPIVTLRWPVRLGEVSGSARLWIPESLTHGLDAAPPGPFEPRPSHNTLAATFRALAGTITLPRGLGRLKAGAVLPVDERAFGGTVVSPIGPIELACRDADGRNWFEASAVAGTSAARLTLTTPLNRETLPREPIPVNPPPATAAKPAEVPVTLTVELGRVNIPLTRLADLQPGDVLELGRHSREPVELTSNGRLIARGELIQFDTELGVRILHVFL
jgi:type III secretion system YscQ/HrcQ family protein